MGADFFFRALASGIAAEVWLILSMLPLGYVEKHIGDGDWLYGMARAMIAHHHREAVEDIEQFLEQPDAIEQILDCKECVDDFRNHPKVKRQRAAAKLTEFYGASTTRRSAGAIDALKSLIYRFADENAPVTVRQTFYHLVSLGAVEKSETEYQRTVIRLCLEMRREGELPYDWVADNTRWIRKPRTFNSVKEALESCAKTYRAAVWRDLPINVEIWCEKDALAGVILEETDPYDVPLMVSRGFASDSYLHQVAEQISKPTWIYYFGDHDPAGTAMDADLEKRLRRFAPMADITFHRVAITEDIITEFKLPTRPTKGRHMNAKFTGDSVDLDALPPQELRNLVRAAIETHIPDGYIEALEVAEKSELEILSKMMSG